MSIDRRFETPPEILKRHDRELADLRALIAARAAGHGHELDDLSDVSVPSPDNGDGVTFHTASGLWVATDLAALFAPLSHVGGGGTAHALATAEAHGFMPSGDKSKLNGVEAGAQVDRAGVLAGFSELTSDGATNSSTSYTDVALSFTISGNHSGRRYLFLLDVPEWQRTGTLADGNRAAVAIRTGSAVHQANFVSWYGTSAQFRGSVSVMWLTVGHTASRTYKVSIRRVSGSFSHLFRCAANERATFLAVDMGPA